MHRVIAFGMGTGGGKSNYKIMFFLQLLEFLLSVL